MNCARRKVRGLGQRFGPIEEKRNNERDTTGKCQIWKEGALGGSIGGASGASRRGFGTHSGPGLCGGNSSLLVEFGNRRLGPYADRISRCLADPLGVLRTDFSLGVLSGSSRGGGRWNASSERWTSSKETWRSRPRRALSGGALDIMASETRRVPCRRVDSVRVDRIIAASFGSRTLPALAACQMPRQKCRNRKRKSQPPPFSLHDAARGRIDSPNIRR